MIHSGLKMSLETYDIVKMYKCPALYNKSI